MEVLDAEAELRAGMRLGLLQMNRIQEQFVRVKNAKGRTPRRRILETGEKCITACTLVETPSGNIPVRLLYESGKPFKVFAWDGKRKIVADASAPFLKPVSPCYRIELSDGRWMEAADRHRILCDGRWYFLEELYELLLSLSASNSGLCLSIRASGELHWSETPSDCRENCLEGFHRCGVRLLSEEGSARVSTPSPGDAPQRTPTSFGMDAPAYAQGDIPCELPFLRASGRSLSRFATRISRFLIEGVSRPIQSFLHGLQSCQLLSTVEGVPLQSFGEYRPNPVRSDNGVSSCEVSPFNPHESGIKIVSFHPITSQEVYDFTVNRYHNYYAGGLINHNSGKTRIGICEDLAHAMGYRPWLGENDSDFRIAVPVPNYGLIGCETMAQSVEAKIRPELEALIPKHCEPAWKNDTTGVLKSVLLKYDYHGRKCGSVLHIRSYNQPADSFRGIDPHWSHWDEPPPRDVLVAAERGKVVTNAPSWFTMTPLKEAYIYDTFSVKAFNNGGSDPEIAVFHGSMWDNCQDWCRDCGVSVAENDPETMADPHGRRPKNRCPQCGRIMGFIPRAGIEEYLKLFTDPDEIAAHIEGKYAHLSGLVYKELDGAKHRFSDFRVPDDWMRVEAVDPHDARPTRWLFAAVSPEDVKINGQPANRIYVYDYLLVSGNIEEIARKVKVKRAEHNYQVPGFVVLDARYGARTTRTYDAESSWEEDLGKAGIERIRLSHSDPGDIALGHKRVKEYLAPHYSAVKGKAVPALLFAEEGTKGERGPWMDISNYQWRPGTDKPSEDYKDFCDCIRYLALEQPVYEPPGKKIDLIAELLAARNETDYHPLGYGLRHA